MQTIWYMGAKTRLRADIAEALAWAAPRASSVLDLMSGSAAVSVSLAPRYRVIANDVQAYSAAIARGYLLAEGSSVALEALDPQRDLGARFRENLDALQDDLAGALALEDAFLKAYGLPVAAEDPHANSTQGLNGFSQSVKCSE